jgi:hypothetical protein
MSLTRWYVFRREFLSRAPFRLGTKFLISSRLLNRHHGTSVLTSSDHWDATGPLRPFARARDPSVVTSIPIGPALLCIRRFLVFCERLCQPHRLGTIKKSSKFNWGNWGY